MLKVDRSSRTFTRLEEPSLSDAQFLERADLQECIANSSSAFFAEIGEDVFVIGTEVIPSPTVGDRIDLLGIDPEGTAVVVELKRGSNKLHLLQAISYAGMIARWGLEDFRDHLSAEAWEELTDSFLKVDSSEINRRQRLLLVAEGYDYALLTGAEWLSESYGVDIRCVSVGLATDPQGEAEYLGCESVFPPPALAEQAVARGGTARSRKPLKWDSWEEAIAQVDNADLRAFVKEELEAGRGKYLPRRKLQYKSRGTGCWALFCRNKFGYVWQTDRFSGDLEFWQSRLSEEAGVSPVKDGGGLSFRLLTAEELRAFRDAVTEELVDAEWT